jgi:hypothetical protein
MDVRPPAHAFRPTNITLYISHWLFEAAAQGAQNLILALRTLYTYATIIDLESL